MARQIELSESEIIEALDSSRRVNIPDPPGAFVISEFCRKHKKAHRTVRAQVAVLREKGLVEHLRVHRVGSDGRQMTVSAYRILKAAPKKARR